MKQSLQSRGIKLALFVTFLHFSPFFSKAQSTETFSSGAFIINMGATVPNTIANGLKPYGLIYDLIRNYQVPVKWVISQTKLKDGVDFIYNNVQYKGGTFIIPAEYRSTAVNNRITYWTGQGVVGITTTSAFSVDVTTTLKAYPKWTLDAKNGGIAEGFLINAGITNIAFPGAYNWKDPQLLDCCDDFFVMPHADPTWATHGNLWSWNKNCLGSIWAGCHAVSVLENMTNPGNPAQKTNFLSTTGLLLFGSHSGGSVPYTHQLPNDPNAQYLGSTDLAQQNGSEQIYMPLAGGSWRPTTQIIAYDPSQANVPANSPGPAAVIVYGRGLGDPARGYVMYEASHSINKGIADGVAAQRGFFNFSFFQLTPKNPALTVTGITEGQQVTNGTLLNLNVSATSPLLGISFTYQWTSTCGGTFGSPTAATTTFNPPVTPGGCVITCKVSDNCGRVSFASFPITVLGPPTPPTVVNDVAAISGSCQPGTSVTVDVLANDVPNTATISFTSLNQGAASPANAGTWTSTPEGLVTFTPDPNFNGLASITYTVTNTQGVSNTATINVTVGSVDVNGCTSNQVYAPAEVNLVTLANLVRQNSTGAVLNGTALDDNEDTYTTAAADYLNLNTSSNDSLVLAIGSTLPLRAKDTINLYWSKGNAAVATVTVRIGQSATGPWTNPQTFTLSPSGTGSAVSTVSAYAIPAGVSGITHVSIRAGNPPTNSGSQVWLDAVEYEYLSCISKKPQLSSDAAVVLEDAPTIIDVIANDADPQGLPLTLSQITVQPTKGKISMNLNGTVTYVSNKDVNGTDFFTYQVCNTQGYCDTATVSITISADGCAAGFYKANPPSGAVTKIFQYQFAGTNAATANPTSTKFSDAYLNQGNTTQVNGTGTKAIIGLQFSATKAERGAYYFDISEIPSSAIVQSAVFSAMRVGGTNTTQTVNVHKLTNSFVETQVSWANRSTGPTVAWTTAGSDFNATPEASVSVTSSKIFYNWNISNMAQGWVNTPANNFGLIQKTGETLNASHQFATKENGTATSRPKLSITYVIPDPCSAIPNRAPLANTDYAATVNGQPVTFNPLTNDADVDPGNTFTVTGVYGVSAGSATFTANSITYTANVNVTVPRTESLKYIITDNNGAKDTAYAYITVTNAPPSINSDVSSTNSGTPVTITVLTNDSDPEGAAIGSPIITVVPKYGTATVSGNNIIYTPGTGYTGKDTLAYQVCEAAAGGCSAKPLCDTALVVITINNQPPVATPDSKTTPPCQTTRIVLVSNDTDPEGGLLTVTNISALSNPAAGTLVNNNDGSVSFTPATGYSGPPVTFTYTVTDNGVTPLTSAPATVTLTVTAFVNNKPVAGDDLADPSNMDETEYISVLDNDSDPDNNPLTNPSIIINPLHGTASVMPNGLVMYTPNPGFFGRDTLTYRVGDIVFSPVGCTPQPPLYDTAILSFNIIVPNTTNAVNDENSTWINMAVSGGVMGNDFDIEGNSQSFTGFIDSNGVAHTGGTMTVSGVDANGNYVPNAGTLTINADGTYTYQPAFNFIGVVTVPYSVSDNNPNSASDTAVLKITVNPLKTISNSVISNNDENLSYGDPVGGNLLVNDRDPQGDAFQVTGFMYDTDGDGIADGTGALNTPIVIGGVTLTGKPTSNAGTITIQADGTYLFTPAPDFHGHVDIPYTICDNGTPVACSTSILHIDVLPDLNGPLNDPPFAGDDFNHTNINTPVNGSFTNNDSDPNSNPISVNGVTINTGGPHTPIDTLTTVQGGTVIFYADGTYTYNPPFNYSGPDQVNYGICDVTVVAPQPLCTTATLYLLVSPGALLPIDLLSFEGKRQGKDNYLHWTTSQEVNSHHFEVEHSTDNSSFTKIAIVTAKGNSSIPSDYSYLHLNPPASVNYYRLKLVDKDGRAKYSRIIALRNDGTEVTLNTVYPNPFFDRVQLSITSRYADAASIRIYDVNGRLVRSESAIVTRGLNIINVTGLEHLAAGTYFLEAKGTETNIITKLYKTNK